MKADDLIVVGTVTPRVDEKIELRLCGKIAVKDGAHDAHVPRSLLAVAREISGQLVDGGGEFLRLRAVREAPEFAHVPGDEEALLPVDCVGERQCQGRGEPPHRQRCFFRRP